MSDEPEPIQVPIDNPGDMDQRDAGMHDGGQLAAIDRRLIHVDRMVEEVEARTRTIDAQVLSLIVMTATLAIMVWIVSKQLREFTNDE